MNGIFIKMIRSSKRFVLVVILAIFVYPTEGLSTLCCDGTISYSTGRGTCSHHGGVCETYYSSSSFYYSSYSSYSSSDDVNDKSSNITIVCSSLTIIDGDTLKYNGVSYRLYGIDAPESYDSAKMFDDASQCNVSEDEIKSLGDLAKKFLLNLLQNNYGQCTIEQRNEDKYGREVALIYLPNGMSLNELLVSSGYAIAWDMYIEESDLKSKWNMEERTAVENKKGLWGYNCQLMNCLAGNIYTCSADEYSSSTSTSESSYSLDSSSSIAISFSGSGTTSYVFQNKQWLLLDFDSMMALLKAFKSNEKVIKVIWNYDNGEWYAFSFDSDVMSGIKNSNINILKKLERKKGYWVYLNGSYPIYSFTDYPKIFDTDELDLTYR